MPLNLTATVVRLRGATMPARAELLESVIDADGQVATDHLAAVLHIPKTELAAGTGLSRDAISKQARFASRAT
jgi:hypothetical protein